MGGGKGEIPVAQPKGVALFTGESAPSASGKGGIDRSQHLAVEGVELHFEERMRCLQRKFPLSEHRPKALEITINPCFEAVIAAVRKALQ